MTSASSFDEDPTVAKARRPKKGKKSRQQELATSVDEKQEMVGYSSAAGSSKQSLLFKLFNSSFMSIS